MAQGERRIYIATMRPHDAEDDARIARHQAERAGCGFETVECHACIEALVGRFPGDASLLLDSTTALLAEEMFGPDGRIDMDAGARVTAGVLALLGAYEDIVVVSDGIYSDACCFDAYTEAYRRQLAEIDRALAVACDGVLECVFAWPIVHKGDDRFAALVQEVAQGISNGPWAVHSATGVCELG